MSTEDLSRAELFIGGKWAAPSSAATLEIVSPSTEEVIGTAPDAGPSDIDAAVRAARAAFEEPGGWRSWPVAERAQAMEALAAEIESFDHTLTYLGAVETGKPVGLFGGGRNRSAEVLRYYAGLARSFVAEEVRTTPEIRPTGSVRSLVRRLPVGVTGAIVPYNSPFILAMYKIAPTLAMGGTIVVKSPPQAPLDLYYLAEAVERVGLPGGVVNIVSGGNDAGQALVGHPGVDKVAFTGSSAAGRAIAEVCGRQLKPVTLELGGKSAAILLDDADLDAFVRTLGFVSFAYTGQNCFIHGRILAPRSREDEVVQAVAEAADALVVGDPLDERTDVGPVITAAHRHRVEGIIASAKDDGARLVTGGGRPAGLDRGWYLEPTVFRDARSDMRFCREEIFGPVVAVIPYDTEEEAVVLANDTDYGLAGSVWTADAAHGVEVAGKIDAGVVGVNGFSFNTGAPFAGHKNSGLGVELGPEGLAQYVQYQSIHLPR